MVWPFSVTSIRYLLYYDSGRLFYTFRDFEQRLNDDDEIVSVVNYGVDDAVKSAELASAERFVELTSLDDELTARKTLGEKLTEVYNFYYPTKDVTINYCYDTPEDSYELTFGDTVALVSSMNKIASIAPLLKLTAVDENTGDEVSLKDFHFEYSNGSVVSDMVAGKHPSALISDSLPFDDKGFENPSGRIVYYGEAIESTSTSMTFFTTTHEVNGELVRTKRMVPTGAVQQTLFINMTDKTITTGSASNIKPGDKVLVNFRYDLNNNCYINVYRW